MFLVNFQKNLPDQYAFIFFHFIINDNANVTEDEIEVIVRLLLVYQPQIKCIMMRY